MEEYDLDREAALLAEKEAWATHVAAAVVEMRVHDGITLEIATAAARSASLWVDGFNEIMAGPDAVDVRTAVKRAREAAVEKSQDLLRYPSGQLTIRAILAMNEAFVLAFEPEDQEFARELIRADAG